MSYIKRHMEKVMKDLASEYPCVLITGPRQVGKTTMMEELIKSENASIPRTYVTLDDFEARSLAKTDPKMFFEIYKTPIFIDEVQYAPELFPYIKIMVDKNKRAGEFILTGSQIFRLMKGVSESLAGRVAILNMQGFSLSEINATANTPFFPSLESLQQKTNKPITTSELFEKILKGSMPALVSGLITDPKKYYSGYINTYLQKDINELSDNIDALRFFKFLTAVAARTSQIVNKADIARDSDLDQRTVIKWLDILETLGIIYYLHPYSNNLLKRSIKAPKLYFYDTGLVCYLTKWSDAETLSSGAFADSIFETFVLSEIMKSYHNEGLEPYLYYYRDVDQKEIDVVIEKDGMLYPIEIKKTMAPNKQMASSFSVIEKATLKQGIGAIICMSDKLSAIDRNTLIIPVSHI